MTEKDLSVYREVTPLLETITGIDALEAKIRVILGVTLTEVPYQMDFGLSDSLFSLENPTVVLDLKEKLKIIGIDQEDYEIVSRGIIISGRYVGLGSSL